MPPKKSLGQHWLHDEASLQAMLEAGEVDEADIVLEVGPGLGTLTKKLCQKANKVIAVELDDTLVAKLRSNIAKGRHPSIESRAGFGQSEVASKDLAPEVERISRQARDDKKDNLEIVHQSILDYDTTDLPKGYKVIANIPYYLTSNLIRRMLESANPPSIMVLLIQKEVAERIVAQPGQHGILSVAVQFYAEAELKEEVPAELFTPPPQVDSQIIKIALRAEPLFPGVDEKAFFKIVKAGFSEKRKMLRSSLSGALQLSKQEVDEWLKAAKISPTARAQELTIEQWYHLLKCKTASSY